MTVPSARVHVRPRRIGILLEAVGDNYELAFLLGALSAAREAGAVVYAVAGGAIDGPELRGARNFAFDLLGAHNVDALVAVSSSIGNVVGLDGLAGWLSRYAPLPIVSVGAALSGITSVQVDNGGGVRDAVLHLVRVHNQGRIAFVGGPAHSIEAQDRLAAYRAGLSECGLSYDAKLVVEGTYLRDSGAQAIRTLFDERRVAPGSIGAVIAANDEMAFGVMDELSRRGIALPERMAVIGFDDLPAAAFVRPALTTIHQPVERLGQQAVQLALARLAGQGQDHVILPTELVTRLSCGCRGPEASAPTLLGRGFEASFIQQRQVILADLMRASRASFSAVGAGWDAKLLEALIQDTRGESAGNFVSVFDSQLRRAIHANAALDLVQDMLSVLRRHALSCVMSDEAARSRLEDTVHEARVLASALLMRAAGERVSDSARRFRAFSRLAEQEMLCGDGAQLSLIAMQHLPPLGIEGCVVVAFANPLQRTGEGRVVLGFHGSSRRAH
jgi:DNA-binding LacI/PurR family transcriptional regulator